MPTDMLAYENYAPITSSNFESEYVLSNAMVHMLCTVHIAATTKKNMSWPCDNIRLYNKLFIKLKRYLLRALRLRRVDSIGQHRYLLKMPCR